MENTRIISRLDVKGENLIKTIRFEGLRKVGKPAEVTKYYNDGVDEIILWILLLVFIREIIYMIFCH